MAYGKIKADTFVYDNSGSDVEVTLSSLGNKANLASPTFTGTVTIPTPTAGDNTTKAASTAFVVAGFAPKDAPAFTGTATGVNLTLSGNLTVNGTTTTINSTTLAVDDKNLELGSVDTPSDTTADGGGITLKGATDKEFKWENSTDAWLSTEHIKVPDSKKLLLGSSADLEIFHDGSNSYIHDAGELRIKGTHIKLRGTNDEDGLIFTQNGSIQLKHDNNLKLETTTTGVTVTGTVTDSKGDVRSIPAKDQGGASEYTLIASDAGKTVLRYGGGLTIPNSVMTTGDAVTIINASGSDITLTQGSGFTLYNTADASTGNRTLAGRGMATIWFPGSSSGYISGAGLS